MEKKEHTSEVPVVGLATLPLTVLGLGGPVGHAAELVTLGEGCVRHALEHVVAGGSGAPGVLRGEGSHQVGNRYRCHCV